jgi:hypothetical protein
MSRSVPELRVFGVQLVGSEAVPQPSFALDIAQCGWYCNLVLFCGCQRNAVPDSGYSGFGFMPNPGEYHTYLCGLELAELGTHEY